MRRRTRSALIATLVAAAAVLTMTGAVLAKEGATVSLAQPIPRDAQPGSTLSVTFTVTILTDTGPSPVYGSPVFVRLIAPDGSTTEGFGTENRSGSGTYTADVVVPAGGITSAEFGMRGSSTDASGKSVRADELFEVTGWVFTTTGVAPGATSAAGGSSGTGGLDLRLAALLGIAAIAAGGMAIGLRRRRPLTTA